MPTFEEAEETRDPSDDSTGHPLTFGDLPER